MTLPPLINSGVLSAVAKNSGELLTHLPRVDLCAGRDLHVAFPAFKTDMARNDIDIACHADDRGCQSEKAPPPVSCKLVSAGMVMMSLLNSRSVETTLFIKSVDTNRFSASRPAPR